MELKMDGFDEKEVKGYFKALDKLVKEIDNTAEKVVKKRVDKDSRESYIIGTMTAKTTMIMCAIHCLTKHYIEMMRGISEELEGGENGGD